MAEKKGKKDLPQIVVALDLGNGGGKFKSDSVDRGYTEAVLARYVEPSDEGRMSKQRNVTHFRVEDDPQLYVAGYEPINEFKLVPIPLHSRNSLARYSQPMFSTYAKIGIATALEGAPDMVPVLLVTSTPAYDFHQPQVREKLDKILNDLHKVYVNGTRKVINIVQYEPMSETEAVLYDLYFDKNGNVDPENETILNEDLLIINCGYGTTDLSRYNKMRYIKLPKETLKTSFRDVYVRCATWLSNALNRQIDAQDVAIQLEPQLKKVEKTYEFSGDPVQGFNDAYKAISLGVYSDLIAEVNGIIDDPDQFKRIAVVGGPVEEWGPHFINWNKRVQVPEDPQFSTVRGMYNWGKYYELVNQQSEIATTKE